MTGETEQVGGHTEQRVKIWNETRDEYFQNKTGNDDKNQEQENDSGLSPVSLCESAEITLTSLGCELYFYLYEIMWEQNKASPAKFNHSGTNWEKKKIANLIKFLWNSKITKSVSSVSVFHVFFQNIQTLSSLCEPSVLQTNPTVMHWKEMRSSSCRQLTVWTLTRLSLPSVESQGSSPSEAVSQWDSSVKLNQVTLFFKLWTSLESSSLWLESPRLCAGLWLAQRRREEQVQFKFDPLGSTEFLFSCLLYI